MLRPERVTAARNLLSVTQAQLAEAAGLTQAMVSMVENLRRPFTEPLAEAFARALNLPIEFFSVQTKPIPRAEVHYRKQATASVRDSDRTHALFCEGFRVTETLLDDSGYPRPLLPTIQDADEVLTPQRVGEIARLTRDALGIDPDSPITNVMRSLERVGIAVAPIGFAETALAKHDGLSWSGGRGQATLIGYVPATGDRDRFTLAHELGHLVLHSYRQSADAETEAHQFAGAFLVPDSRAAELIPPDSTLQQLARVKGSWGISIAALVKRGEAAGTLNRDRVSTLYRQISSRGWRKEEPVPVGAETPRLLFRLLQTRYGEHPFAAPSIEHDLALPIMTLRALAPAPVTAGRRTDAPRPVAHLRAL